MTEEDAQKIVTYCHYQGRLYRYIGIARHSETEQEMVVYEHLWPHASSLQVSPAALFNGLLENGARRFVPL